MGADQMQEPQSSSPIHHGKAQVIRLFFVVNPLQAGRQQHEGPLTLPDPNAIGEFSAPAPAAVTNATGAGSARPSIPGEGAAAPQPDETEEPLEKRSLQPIA